MPVTLELGGKSPLVVFADADLDRVVAAAVSTVAFNAGQVCSATTRLLVEASVHDELAARVVDAVARLQPGVDFGPMITEAQYHKVLDHFAAARAEGAEPAVGGAAYDDGPGGEGLFVRPTVYAGRARPAHRPRGGLRPRPGHHAVRRRGRRRRAGQRHRLRPRGQRLERRRPRGLRVAEQIDAGQVAVNGGP